MTEKLPAVQERRDREGLTPLMRLGAYFEAQGFSREDVAQATGVTVTSVSRWRRESIYNKEIARWQSVEIEKFELLLGRYRFQALDGAMSAIRSALDHLDAEDERGRPDYVTQREAQKTLIQNANQVMDILKRPEAGPGGAQAAAAITLVLKSGEEPQIVDAQPIQEEVTNDADR